MRTVDELRFDVVKHLIGHWHLLTPHTGEKDIANACVRSRQFGAHHLAEVIVLRDSLGHQHKWSATPDHRQPLEPLDDSGDDRADLVFLAIRQSLQQQAVPLYGPRHRLHEVVAIEVAVQLHVLPITGEHRLLISGAQAVERFGDDPFSGVGHLVVDDRIPLRCRIGNVEDDLNAEDRGLSHAVEPVRVVGQAPSSRAGLTDQFLELFDRAEQSGLARGVSPVDGSGRQDPGLAIAEEGVLATALLASDHREINRIVEGFPVLHMKDPQHCHLQQFKNDAEILHLL